ncbi:MAG TPA: TIGR03085 family metal-binding protein [Candidatus Nanopelagicales bacterium]|nr:TIGR03085 family metal-binding protein [Candidatus Nanopelagicales bacterium]
MTAPLCRTERADLCDLMLELGPDAPTLSGSWTTRDLAAHLVVRENRPDAAMGLMLPPLRGWLDRVTGSTSRRPFEELVSHVRSGPPLWSPVRFEALDVETNTIEFFVHHEDVRRAQETWEPRVLPDSAVDALAQRMPKVGRLLLRRCPVGVVVSPTDGPAAGSATRLRQGERYVTLVGPTAEIVLAKYGRITRGLEIRGDDADVRAFLAFPR